MKRNLPKLIPLVLAGGAVAAFAGLGGESAAHETAAVERHGLRCAIVTRDLGDAVEISGTVTAQRPVTGEYALSIRQQGAAGSSMIDQSGEFTVGAGRSVTLGQATLGGAASRYRAELELMVNGQRLRCRGADDATDL